MTAMRMAVRPIRSFYKRVILLYFHAKSGIMSANVGICVIWR